MPPAPPTATWGQTQSSALPARDRTPPTGAADRRPHRAHGPLDAGRAPSRPTHATRPDPTLPRGPSPHPRPRPLATEGEGLRREAGSERTGRGWWADVAGQTRTPRAPRAGGDAEAPSDGRLRRRPGNGPGQATGGGGRRAPRVSRGSEAPGGPDPGDSVDARASTPPFPRRAEGAAARESGGRTAPETEARRDNSGPPRGRPEGAGTDAPGAVARRTRRPRHAGQTEAGRGSWARRDRAHSLRTTADPGPRRARASHASGRAPAPPARPLLPLSNLSRPAGRHRAGPPAPRGGEKARPPAASRS
ncbi:translation initiation factor IF-2-like, partial [Equus quagga]|uniref:translation initiation factor IF-2-like n=1 Tax=Equus quagga TaxID=89248 RepID=UPI001EE234CC